MSRIAFPIRNGRRGIAAFAVVAVLALISISIVGMIMGNARDFDVTVTRIDSQRAFYAAEAGISMGVREVLLNSDIDGDGSIGGVSDDGNAANNPVISGSPVSVARQSSGTGSRLIARSTAGSTLHQIETVVSPDTGGTAPGLFAEYFASATMINNLSGVDWTAQPTTSLVASQINCAESSGQSWPSGPTNNWGRRYTGKINIPQSGTWTFYTNSDDGSDVWINGVRIVDNDGTHSMQVRSGNVVLSAGQHDIEIRWFERTGVFGLVLYWSGPGVPSQTIVPASALSH